MLSTKSIFSDLSEDDREAVLRHCNQRMARKKEEIVQQGGGGHEMYIVRDGRLRMSAVSESGKEIGFGILEAGDTFGEMAMLDGQMRSATVTALEPCELMVLTRPSFERLVSACPSVAINLMVILSHRLRHTSRLYQDSVFLEVPGRLAQFLLQFSTPDEAMPGTASLDVSLSQYELGTLVNASRESVNKQLMEWEGEGIIERANGNIRILDSATLESAMTCP